MVRLFVPEGEGQHALTTRFPGALAAQPDIVSSPWRSCVAAAGITGFLALAGKSSPGTFLKATALCSVFDLTSTACGIYGRREMNRGVFKMNNIEPKPGVLWERTKHWTLEDATLSGGALGLLVASNSRSLPGVSGWRRILGSVMVGAAFGSLVGQTALVRLPPQLLASIDEAIIVARFTHYDRLQENEEAKVSLSRFGKLSLTTYTWPALRLMRLLRRPGAGVTADGSQPGVLGKHSVSPKELENTVTFHAEFEKKDLTVPDLEEGRRVYKDSMRGKDAKALNDYLDHLQQLKQSSIAETQYLWQELAKKERKFYDIIEEDDEKDLSRREIQLLNCVATDMVWRNAVLTYHIADARKQLGQIKHKDTTFSSALAMSDPLQGETFAEGVDQHSPQMATNHIRKVWTRQKEVLAHMEQAVSQLDAMEGDESIVANRQMLEPQLKSQIDHLHEGLHHLTKNVEATGRLLREFEEQVRKADTQARK